MTDDVEGVVLHVVRIKGLAPVEVIAEWLGTSLHVVESSLQIAEGAGLVAPRTGRISGWMLTPAGRDAHATWLLGDRARTDVAAVEGAYGAFLVANQRVKELCTEWQLEGRPRRCIDDLSALHDSLSPALERLGAAVPRFATYDSRFREALVRLRAGDDDAFAMPMARSFHDVWMELHEDLLQTLGRKRSETDGH